MMQIPHVQSLKKKKSTYTCFILVIQHFIDKNKLFKKNIIIFSSPGPKVQVNYCHHLASVVCRLLSVVCKLFTFQASSPKPLG